MARKNSPALFEVIRNAQQKQKEQLEKQARLKQAADAKEQSPASALLWSPTYWVKGKRAHEATIDPSAPAVETAVRQKPAVGPSVLADLAEASPVEPTPVKIPAPKVAAPVFREVPAEPVLPTIPAVPVIPAAPSVQRYAAAFESPAAAAARQVREEIAAQEAPAAEPMFGGSDYARPFDDTDDDTDPKTSPFNFQFNATTAIVSGFAVMVAFVVFYVIGTAGNKTGTTTLAHNARPDVLNVGQGATAAPVQQPARVPAKQPIPAVVNDDESRASVNTAADAINLDTIGKPVPVPTNVKRVIGHQYLVLLSFPRPEDAQELVKFLAQNGVPASAERALPGYARSWTSVVTARGFDHTKKNPAFDAYSASLQDLLQKYAGGDKFRKTFKIDLYTWRTAR